jgi:SH3-like domain-containing protein
MKRIDQRTSMLGSTTATTRGSALGAVMLTAAVVMAARMPDHAVAQTAIAQLPRFVSLKSDRVNMRSGPSTDQPILWVYRRAGLPLEVLQEGPDGWRKVRDSEGAAGWVLQTVLSNRRTALIVPWDVKPGTPPTIVMVRTEQSDRSAPVAEVEAGVIANIVACDGSWCRVSVGDAKGHVEQKKLWGVYPGEAIK